jgi:hypothetical protein
MADRVTKRYRSDSDRTPFPSGDVLALILGFLPQATTFKSIVLVCKAFSECVKTNPLAWPARLLLKSSWHLPPPPVLLSKNVTLINANVALDKCVLATEITTIRASGLVCIPPLPHLRSFNISNDMEVDVPGSLGTLKGLVTLHANVCLRGGSDVGLFPSLKTFKATRTLTRDQAALLERCPNLENLHVLLGILDHIRPTVTLATLAGRLPCLRSLTIDIYGFDDQQHLPSILRLLETTPCLRIFEAASLHNIGDVLVTLSRHCREIEALTVDTHDWTDEQSIRGFQGFPKLKTLVVRDATRHTAPLLCRGNKIERLTVYFSELQSGQEAINWVSALSSLRALALTNVCLDVLFPLLVPNLTSLSLFRIHILGDPATFLGALSESCPRLQTLNIFQIGAAGESFCDALSSFVARCPDLRTLCVHRATAALERTCARCGVKLETTNVWN